MKLTYNWLKDFVDIKIPAAALADKLTMAGLEVTSLEERLGDFVFEIEITSNRPDWLSVIGIAREVAAVTGKKFRQLQASDCKLQVKIKNLRPTTYDLKPVAIKVEDNLDCPLYTAKIIRDVQVGPSPEWLKKRLELIGCRSINNVVDITNYILFETGEPLHAFDLDKIAVPQGPRDPVPQLEIKIRRAKNQEKLVTIDAVERTLTPDILVIANAHKPLAIAGIMGGKDTEVGFGTKNILLEAAVFNASLTRRARQQLGLQTDSSYRFERGVDTQTAQAAAWRATQLIQDITAGKCVSARAAGYAKSKIKAVQFDTENFSRILGAKIPEAKIKNILINLGFELKTKAKHKLEVIVPSFRQDVFAEIDLIEEIARIFGYEHIPDSLPQIQPRINSDTSRDIIGLLKNTLIGSGLNEVITYSLINRDWLKEVNLSCGQAVEILNPLSKEQEILRPSIVPSLAKCVAFNLDQKQSYVAIFETAKIFSSDGKAGPLEELALGIALCGEKSMLLEKGLVQEKMGLRHLKGIISAAFKCLGIEGYSFKMNSANLVSIEAGGELLGAMSRLSKQAMDNLGIKNKEVVVAEINLEKALPLVNLRRKFIALPRYPGINRDISILVSENITLGELLTAIAAQGKPYLTYESVAMKDNYIGKQIPVGFKAVTISCLYRLEERTLTEEEINPYHASIVEMLKLKFNAQIR